MLQRVVLVLMLIGVRTQAQCPAWSTGFGPLENGTDGRIYDLEAFQPSGPVLAGLVACGEFTQCGSTSASYIALWNGTGWNALGSNANNGWPYALASDLTIPSLTTGQDELYAGGSFTLFDGTPIQHIAVWASASGQWLPLEDAITQVDGTDGNVLAITHHDDGISGTRLIAAGTFSSAGGKLASNIAAWDGSEWSNLDSGTSGITPEGLAAGGLSGWIDALCSRDGILYAGGFFTMAGGVPASLVARWDGATWEPLGAGLFGANVYDLAWFDADGSTGPEEPMLYAVGDFSVSSSGPRVNVARWNGSTWTAVGGGLSDITRELLVYHGGCRETLIVCGLFSGMVSRLEGAAWQPIGSGLAGSYGALCLADYDGGLNGKDLFVGGIFEEAAGQPSNYIASACVCQNVFPIAPGEAVVTNGGSDDDDFVLTVIDTRAPRAPTDSYWDAPKFHNEVAPSAPSEKWTRQNLGQVFGVCFDGALQRNIYVAATSIYAFDVYGPGGPGAIYKINGTNGDISLFQVLPNTGPGLGDICYSARNRVFYVSNFEDGKIYVLGLDGTVKQAWDPFAPDTSDPGFAPLGERIWAVQKLPGRDLAFSAWLQDSGPGRTDVSAPASWPAGAPSKNSIFQVQIGPGGLITGSPVLAKSMPDLGFFGSLPYSNPVSDIAVIWPDPNDSARILLAERTMLSDTVTGAHFSRVLEWFNVAWYLSDNNPSGWNSSGGADWNCSLEMLATGDALLRLPSNDYLYGIELMPTDGYGQVPPPSWQIDLNGVIDSTYDKYEVGDIECYRSCFPSTPSDDRRRL